MTYYLLVILSGLDVLRFYVTTDKHPTHSDAENWELVKEFTL